MYVLHQRPNRQGMWHDMTIIHNHSCDQQNDAKKNEHVTTHGLDFHDNFRIDFMCRTCLQMTTRMWNAMNWERAQTPAFRRVIYTMLRQHRSLGPDVAKLIFSYVFEAQ